MNAGTPAWCHIERNVTVDDTKPAFNIAQSQTGFSVFQDRVEIEANTIVNHR